MGNSRILRVELDLLASLGLSLQSLANEAASLRTAQSAGLSCPAPVPGGMEPAVLEAASIAGELVDTVLVSAVENRLSETGQIMMDVAKQYRHADEATSLDTVMATYTNAIGIWDVPEAPR